MMWAMGRQYSGDVKYCWPASCFAVLTSHSRNSAFRRPSLCRVLRPVTSACALMVLQFLTCGSTSMVLVRAITTACSLRHKIFPFLEIGSRKVRLLAFDDRVERHIMIDPQIWPRRRAFRHRHAVQPAGALQADRKGGFRFLRLVASIGLFPEAFDL